MTNIYKVVRATAADYKEIAVVWEASVRATHFFLKEEDILLYKSLMVSEYLPVVNLCCIRRAHDQIMGFLGTSADKIEMLFISPDCRGMGVGKELLQYAVDTLGVRKVDVNEQNQQAVGFYQHAGFQVTGRSETDGMGKPYPLLHLAFIK